MAAIVSLLARKHFLSNLHSPRLRNQLPSRALRIQKIPHKLDSENVIATRVNFSRKHFTLSTKETVNDIDQRSQLLVLAFEKVTLPTVETKRNPQKREHENLKMEKGKRRWRGGGGPRKLRDETIIISPNWLSKRFVHQLQSVAEVLFSLKEKPPPSAARGSNATRLYFFYHPES